MPRYHVAAELCLPFERIRERTDLQSFVALEDAENFAAAAHRVLDGTGPNRIVVIDQANGTVLCLCRRLETAAPIAEEA
jgi:hypothetical protein